MKFARAAGVLVKGRMRLAGRVFDTPGLGGGAVRGNRFLKNAMEVF